MAEKMIPAGPHRAEISILNSRFIASAAPAFSTEAAREFVRRVRDEFKDASHNVPAFIIGHGSSIIEHSSDDGEPSGTAGRPALAVLRGSGLGDIVVVVTRYFGGKKLGKGGLVRAYTDAVKAVLETLPLARKTATDTLQITIEYALFERLRMLASDFESEILSETFTEVVNMVVRLDSSRADLFREGVIELSQGRAAVERIGHDPESIFPLTHHASP